MTRRKQSVAGRKRQDRQTRALQRRQVTSSGPEEEQAQHDARGISRTGPASEPARRRGGATRIDVARTSDLGRRRIRRRWSAGVVLAVVGVLVAVVGIAQDWWANREDSDLSVARVRATEVAVKAGSDGPATTTIGGAAVDILLRNDGDQPAIIEKKEVRLHRSWTLTGCLGGGPEVSTATYDVVIPNEDYDQPTPMILYPADTTEFTVDPHDAEAFSITVGSGRVGEFGWPPVSAVEVLLYERGKEPVSAGRAVLMDGWRNNDIVDLLSRNRFDVLSGDPVGARACFLDQVKDIDEAMALGGVRSAALEDLHRRLHEIDWIRRGDTGDPLGSPTPGRVTPSTDPARPRWVAQVGLLAESTPPAAVAAEQRRLGTRYGVPIGSASSATFRSLEPGTIALFFDPGFPTGIDAINWCQSKNVSGRAVCAGRYLSKDTADRSLLCYVGSSLESKECFKEN